jgi:hypothetical protein
LSGQAALTNCQFYGNQLTNLSVDGCYSLVSLDVHNNYLSEAAVNNTLCFLDSSASNISFVDLSGPHNGFVTGAGLTCFYNLISRNVQVYANLATTNSVPGPANSITFVTISNSVLSVTASGTATVVWHSGLGLWQTNTLNSSSCSNNFAYQGTLTNYVIIDPTNALVSFGEAGNHGDGWIDSVSNLAAFPNLVTLDLWRNHLVNLDLTGCASLLYVRVAGNFESQSNTDAWLSQLAAAATNDVHGLGATFYYNDKSSPSCWASENNVDNGVTVGSAAYNALVARGWTIYPWCQ